MPYDDEARQEVLHHHIPRMYLTPQAFSARWDVNYEELAQLCCVSKSTTYHWLGGQTSRRVAGLPYQRILALTDFLLTYPMLVLTFIRAWESYE